LIDLDGEWPSWNDIKNGAKNIAGKVGKTVGDFASSNVGKVVITVGAIAAVGVASVVTGGAAGVVLATVAAGAAGGATVGGISNMVTGGSFANGFIGGAISGGIGSLGTALGVPHIGNMVGGMLGSGVTTYLDNPDVDMGELAKKSLMGGITQTAFSTTIGNFFDNVSGETSDIAIKAILEYFKSVYDVGGSTVSEIIYLIFNNKNKVKVVSTCIE